MAQDAMRPTARPPERLSDILPTPQRGSTVSVTGSMPTRLPMALLRQLEIKPGGTVASRSSAALRLLKQECASEIQSRAESRWQGDAFYDAPIIGYQVMDAIPDEAVPVCREIIRVVTAPASVEDVQPTLSGLVAMYPSKIQTEDGTTMDLWMKMVWRFIEDYPLDVIRESLESIMKTAKFLPMPEAFVRECERIGSPRMALKDVRFETRSHQAERLKLEARA